MSESPYDWNPFGADQEKMRELMTKMGKCFPGYSRMVIVLACSRTIAAMFGPAEDKSRQDYLDRFPGYMRSMWKLMDEAIPKPQ